MDGGEVLAALRAGGSRVPVIILTGQGDEQIAVALMKAGATDYLIKGQLTPDTLASSLRYALRLAQAEQQTQVAQQRLQVLALTNDILMASLDYRTTLPQAAAMLVDQFVDCCTIDLWQPGGTIERIATALSTAIPTTGPVQAAPVAVDDGYGPGMVWQTDQPTQYADVWHDLAGQLRPDHQHFIATTGLTSWLSVPVRVCDTILGVLSLGRHRDHPRLVPTDRVFAEELAQRMALAIEHELLYQQAQEAVQTRDAFLSIAAHELKNPLAGVLGYSELLQRRMLRQGQLALRDQPMLEKMTDQVRRLHRLVEPLFDVSRLHLGQLELELRSVDVGLLTSEVLQTIEPTLEQHSLQVTIAPEPLLVMGDALRLEQVLMNMLQNAIKYSPDGGAIHVRVTAADQGVQVTVQDEGIGIPEAARGAIFERFYRASNTERHGVSGMGVGLYVVRQIVEVHQGYITVTSEEGQGSTFHIWLPAVTTVPA